MGPDRNIILLPHVNARYNPYRGVSVQCLRIPERHTWGRSAEIDLKGVQARLLVNNGIIQRSFHPAGLGYQPPEVNSGESLPDWLKHPSAVGRLPILVHANSPTGMPRPARRYVAWAGRYPGVQILGIYGDLTKTDLTG